MTTHDEQHPPAPARGQIHDGLEAAERAEFTRPVPKGAAAQFRFLLARAKGSTAAVAARLGISRRTVQRYAAGTLKRPQKALRANLAEETARDWQPGVRARAREQASSTGGLRITTRAHFGFRAAPAPPTTRARGSSPRPSQRTTRAASSPPASQARPMLSCRSWLHRRSDTPTFGISVDERRGSMLFSRTLSS
ncbi:MAG: hypothetical protein JWP44_4781 [Mucilaginibacter sp.]|nr:hypothetical protein [Mucilaginibacter sp.]